MREFFNDIKAKLHNASEEQFSYLFSVFLLIVLLLAKICSHTFNYEFNDTLFVLPLITLLYGFAHFIVPFFIKHFESKLGKFIISFLVFIGGVACLGFAKQFINLALRVPSSAFEHTQTVVSILFVPIMVGIVFSILGFILMPMMMVVCFQMVSISSLKDFLNIGKVFSADRVNPITGFLRLFLFIVIVSSVWSSFQKVGWYLEEVAKFAAYIAYEIDSEQFSHCKKNENERVAYINQSNIVLSKKIADDKFEFYVAKCN